MPIPTEPIGSIPRPGYLVAGLTELAAGNITHHSFEQLLEKALNDTIRRFDEVGSPIVTDGEQGKPSFATYPLSNSAQLAADGVVIPFADGHTRQLPRLTEGPFRYAVRAGEYVRLAKVCTSRPIKQAVIAPSAISLIYPSGGIERGSRVTRTTVTVSWCSARGRGRTVAR